MTPDQLPLSPPPRSLPDLRVDLTPHMLPLTWLLPVALTTVADAQFPV